MKNTVIFTIIACLYINLGFSSSSTQEIRIDCHKRLEQLRIEMSKIKTAENDTLSKSVLLTTVHYIELKTYQEIRKTEKRIESYREDLNDLDNDYSYYEDNDSSNNDNDEENSYDDYEKEYKEKRRNRIINKIQSLEDKINILNDFLRTLEELKAEI